MSKLGCWSGGELVGASEQQTNSKSEIRNPILLRQGSFDATSPSSLRFDATRGKPKSEIRNWKSVLVLRSVRSLRFQTLIRVHLRLNELRIALKKSPSAWSAWSAVELLEDGR